MKERKLRAKTPEVKESRFKALLFANCGAGKTHFCCSLPYTYYIDTEKLEDYKKFVEMIKANKGHLVYLTELNEIINEVTALLATKHSYKTLIIDSLSFPFAWLCQTEAERLAAKSNNEGTEYAANTSKAKRLIFKLGILLSRLDMNVVVISHEKTEFADGKDIGKIFDINDKMAYSLGTVLNLKLLGDKRKLFVRKSRYSELPNNALIDFDDGYQEIKNRLGENIFTRESKNEELITPDQIKQLNRLIEVLKIPEETVNKALAAVQASEIQDMSRENAEKYINHLKSKVEGAAE